MSRQLATSSAIRRCRGFAVCARRNRKVQKLSCSSGGSTATCAGVWAGGGMHLCAPMRRSLVYERTSHGLCVAACVSELDICGASFKHSR
eukprot:scaffold29027_cov20-Tisochrysis_lutea.AAC.3